MYTPDVMADANGVKECAKWCQGVCPECALLPRMSCMCTTNTAAIVRPNESQSWQVFVYVCGFVSCISGQILRGGWSEEPYAWQNELALHIQHHVHAAWVLVA